VQRNTIISNTKKYRRRATLYQKRSRPRGANNLIRQCDNCQNDHHEAAGFVPGGFFLSDRIAADLGLWRCLNVGGRTWRQAQ
jgi:hypothetical protein